MNAKTILITGANRGLGLELVKQIVKLENPPRQLFAACRNPDAAQDLTNIAKENKSVKVVKLEVCNQSSIENCVQEVQGLLKDEGLNVLINNAGAKDKVGLNLETLTSEAMMDCFKINTIAPLMMCQAFGPLLKKAAASSSGPMGCQRGAVFNLSTIMSSCTLTEQPNDCAYRSTKCALNMVTKCLSLDWKKDDVLVVGLHPGWVQTDMGGQTAPLTPQQSVSGLLSVMGKLSDGNTGFLYDYAGTRLEF